MGYYRFASDASATNSSGFTSKAEDGTYNGNATSGVADFILNGGGSNGNNWNGSTLIIGRDNGAGGISEDANDVLAANSGSNLSFNSGDVLWSNTTIGSYTNSGGKLSITFNSNANTSAVHGAVSYTHLTLPTIYSV